MGKLTYSIHDLMYLRHSYYYDIQLYDLLPPQKKKRPNKGQQDAHMVTLDYTSGKIVPISAFLLLQSDTTSSNMQMNQGVYPPIWSPPLSSIPNTLPQIFQNSGYPFQGVMVPVVNFDHEFSVPCGSLPFETQNAQYASPTWYNSPISPPPQAATIYNAVKDKTVELAGNGEVSSGGETSSDDIFIQIHSSNKTGSKV